MKCPVDNATLVMTERAGVEIDYCPECRGVWLDRGELDKIIQRDAGETRAPRYQESERHYNDEHDHRTDRHDHYEQDRSYGRGYDDKKKRRGSFIGDIFGGFGED